jgi:very-short-patch-repair endonuclease
MAQSGFERNLQFQMKAVKLPVPEVQFRFHPTRRWTFDFAWLDLKLYCEVEGGIFIRGGGRHNRGASFEKDCEKYAEAAILGWRGLRVTTGQVKSGVALQSPVFVHPADRPLAPPAARRGKG